MANYTDLSKEQLLDVLDSYENRTKFGLVWESSSVPELLIRRNLGNYVGIKESLDSRFVQNNQTQDHLLIKGDNWLALKAMSTIYNEKVDIIYIDPPYNTGNQDFIYNDNYVDKEDSFRHSKWLTFMKSRLDLAKKLLKPDGVIYVSIGTDEQCRLQILMEQIFGEQNYLGTISRVQKSGSSQGTYFAPSIDYIICFAKQKNLLSGFKQKASEEYLADFKLIDNAGRRYKEKGLYQSSLDPLRGCVNQRYYIECPDGSFCIPPGDNFPEVVSDASKIKPITKNDKVWRWKDESYLEKRNEIIFKKTNKSPLLDQFGNQSKWNVYTKQILDDEASTLPRDFLEGFENSKGTTELRKMGVTFDFAKPRTLIEHLILITGKEDPLVLDFFAGSGTTAHAVVSINKRFNMRAKFIVCTNNEKGIADNVCIPRITKALSKSELEADWMNCPGNFRVYETNFIEKTGSSDGDLIAIEESALNLILMQYENVKLDEENKDWSIYNAPGRIIAFFRNLDRTNLETFVEKIRLLEGDLDLYVFSLDLQNELETDLENHEDIFSGYYPADFLSRLRV